MLTKKHIERTISVIEKFRQLSIFRPATDALSLGDWKQVLNNFELDYGRYYSDTYDPQKIKYFPGLIATLFYRISRHLFLLGREAQAQEFASLGFENSGTELYYSSNIGKALKINHSIDTVVGARVKLGDNVLLHHSVTFGDKNGGRPTIGNDVVVYPGAVIVGDIKIGNNCIIGANTFVDKSYPDNSIIK